MPTRIVAIAVVALAVAACTRENKQYCADENDCALGLTCDGHRCTASSSPDGRAVDAALPDADPAACTSSTECTEPTAPICDPGDQRCRGCTGNEECAEQSAATPVCASSGACVQCAAPADCSQLGEPICDNNDATCRPCGADSECLARDPLTPVCANNGHCVQCSDHDDCGDLGVCDHEAALCVPEAAIIYIDGTSDDNGPSCGELMSPCETITAGLAKVSAGRTTLRLANGLYTETITVDGLELALVGTEASIRSASANKPCLLATGGAAITIDRVGFRGAVANTDSPGNTSDADGLACSGADTTVTMSRVTMHGNDADGLDVHGECTAVIRDSSSHDNGGVGLRADDAALTAERNYIFENLGGGVSLAGASFHVTNNFLYRNGDSSSGLQNFGGASITSSTNDTPPGTIQRVFEFNTLVANTAGSIGTSTGVSCSVNNPDLLTVTIANNIIRDGTGTPPPTWGSCHWSYNNVDATVAGTGNINADPNFITPTEDDYHLHPNSPCEGAASTATSVTADFDGDGRPQGTGFDIGADELAP